MVTAPYDYPYPGIDDAVFRQPQEWHDRVAAVQAEGDACLARLRELAAAAPNLTADELAEWVALCAHQTRVLDPAREALADEGHQRYLDWLRGEGDR